MYMQPNYKAKVESLDNVNMMQMFSSFAEFEDVTHKDIDLH